MSYTIAAVSTGNVVSAIGIIRLSGDDAIAIAEKVFTLTNQKALSAAPGSCPPSFSRTLSHISSFSLSH